MEQKKRILLVHNFYQLGGGEDTVFANERRLLEQKGHAVYTYTRSNQELKTAPWKLLLLPLTTLWSWQTFFYVRRLIAEKGIDIVHCHNTFPLISPSVYYAARSRKVPVIQTIHNYRFLCPNGLCHCRGAACRVCLEKNSFLPALKNRCYRGSPLQTAVVVAMLKLHRLLGTYRKISYVFLTEFTRSLFSDLVDISGENVFVKPNFVFSQRESASAVQRKPCFVYAGRLEQSKGILFLLEAWKALPEDYELHIYGDGPCREACEAAAGERSNIRVYGFCSREQVFSDLCNAAGLVFPSLCYETFGMAPAESFSLGRPVLASDFGCHGELVRVSRGGVTYEPGNIQSFAAAAKELVAGNVRYSENAWRYYNQHLTANQNYEMLCEIYERAKHIP